MVIQRRVFVSGVVQGVGFRASTLKTARKFPNLKGFVRNLKDGRVEAVFLGDEKDVFAMIEWCTHGPKLAKVLEIQVNEEEPLGSYDLFKVSTDDL